MNKHRLHFLLLLICTWPLRYLPYSVLHWLGKQLGTIAYYILPKFRKRALSNLKLASALSLSNAQIRFFAKASMQNLLITCLEYPKLASEKHINGIVTCINPQKAQALLNQDKAVIFFCGHQANWELLFLEGSARMAGVAIGRPIKNKPLYDWVLSIREKFGGKIISPQNAIREGLRALKKGLFLGIVGDQGMPDSGYCSLFLGRPAWSSPIAAILAHRTGSPIIVATTKRENNHYWIHYSDPIWPQKEAPLAEETDRLMKLSLSILEESIEQNPGQWLWSHNRWKQQLPHRIKKAFRHESLLIILSSETPVELLSDLGLFRFLYPLEFITIYTPHSLLEKTQLEGADIRSYTDINELFKEDYQFKLVFNLTPIQALKTHFKKLAAFTVFSLNDLDKTQKNSLSEQLKTHILKSDAL